MIELGSCDPDVTDAACAAYEKEVEQITRLPLTQVQAGADSIVTRRLGAGGPGVLSVSDVQRGLKTIGFFPGGPLTAFAAYRTLSAIRLFQEYVRTIEKLDSVPDGRFGPASQQHLQRWIEKDLRPDWAPTIERLAVRRPWRQTEYTEWLSLLEQVKAQYQASPNRDAADGERARAERHARGGAMGLLCQGQPASHRCPSHGVQRQVRRRVRAADQGTRIQVPGATEPAHRTTRGGTPFLVQGQHDYHFGWHKKTYLALRPQGKGVLVVRSKNDKRLDDADLAGGLETEPTINIHWGGMGMTRDVNSWSEGCQVINGAVYLNSNDDLIDCSAFSAVTPSQATDRSTQQDARCL